MPTFEITAPDGRKFRITAPEGATQEQVLAYAQANTPRSAKEQAQADVAAEYGPLEAGMVSAGRTLDRLYQGGKQLALRVPAAFGSESARNALDAQAKEEAYKTQAFGALEKARPVATVVGGAAPLLAAPVLGAGAVGMAGSAALPGLIEYGTPQERLTRGAIGGAAGLAGFGLAKGLERFLRPVQTAPDAARQAATQAAERIGYEVPVGQRTGSRTMQSVEQQLGKNPFSAGGAQAMNDANQRAINQAYARSIGEQAPSITDDVLNAAKARIGGQFDTIAARNTVDVAQEPLLNALVKLDAEQRALGSFADDSVRSLVDKGLDLAARKQVDGKTYQIIRSELGRKANSALNGGNSTLGMALKEVQRALDEAANSSISAADQAAWKQARAQWSALKIASKRNGVIEGGNVSAARLATKVDKQRGMIPPDIADIAKIGETFKPLPDSGTASNAVVQTLISGGAGLLGPGPLAVSLGAPVALQKFMRSGAGQKYLSEGLMALTPEQRRLLELIGSGALSAPATYAQ